MIKTKVSAGAGFEAIQLSAELVDWGEGGGIFFYGYISWIHVFNSCYQLTIIYNYQDE